ncbi:MAG: tyrosine-type recombinase/integrase [Bacteroidia bacterium]|nr:tyrosine-type recombinase/integrase [Bacteroidia bacterium]
MLTEKFFRYLQFEKRFSQHTLISYKKDLQQFADFLKKQYEEKNLEAATHFYIRSWIVSLMDSKMQARSVNRKISALRSFYRFLVKEGLLETSPMKKIVAPKIPAKIPHFIHQEKMADVFAEQFFEDSFEGRQEKIILEILYATGMRRAELSGLKDTDIDFGQGVIRVLGKRNKERLIPMLPSLARSLKSFLDEKNNLHDCAALLVSNKSEPLGTQKIYSIVKKHLAEAGTTGKKSPHVLRHTFATHLLNNGADINAIKEILGHASLAATQVYTHNTIEKLKNIYKQAHPKA